MGVFSELGVAMMVVFGSYGCLAALVVLARMVYIFVDSIRNRRLSSTMYTVRGRPAEGSVSFLFFFSSHRLAPRNVRSGNRARQTPASTGSGTLWKRPCLAATGCVPGSLLGCSPCFGRLQLIFQALCCIFWLGLYIARTYVSDQDNETRLLNPVEVVALAIFCVFVIDYIISLLIAEDRCTSFQISCFLFFVVCPACGSSFRSTAFWTLCPSLPSSFRSSCRTTARRRSWCASSWSSVRCASSASKSFCTSWTLVLVL